MNKPFEGLLTSEELQAIHDLGHLVPIIKNKWFSLGNEWLKIEKCLNVLGKPVEPIKTPPKPNTPISLKSV